MLRLRRLKINKFRAVKPGTEIRFNDGCNVVLGRNATGKTTLLELISMALRFDFSSIREEDFDVEVEIDEILEGTSNSVVMQVGTRVDESENTVPMPGRRQRIPWVKASIRVGSDTFPYEEDGSTWRLLKNEISLTTLTYVGEWGRLLLWWASLNLAGRDRSGQLMVPIWGSVARESFYAVRHDESLDAFNKDILQGLRVELDYGLVGDKAHVILSDPSSMQDESFAPATLKEQVRSRFEEAPNTAVLSFFSKDLPFLDEFVGLCHFESAELKLSLLARHHVKELNDGSVTFGEPSLLFTRKVSGDQFRHELLSFGQKRLLSLLYFLEASPGHLVADEMVNGLHHEWIEVLMEKLGGRQTFLSSQNPLLLDYLEFESADEVSRSFVLCELDESDHMVWRNMSAEEAASFYSAYEVGIQHVGEILRTKGLW